jgi:hypothetical protein
MLQARRLWVWFPACYRYSFTFYIPFTICIIHVKNYERNMFSSVAYICLQLSHVLHWWLRSSAFWPGTHPSVPLLWNIFVMIHLLMSHQPFLPHDFPFPMSGKEDLRGGCRYESSLCLPLVGKVGHKICFNLLSKLCSDSSLQPLRARGLLVATVM